MPREIMIATGCLFLIVFGFAAFLCKLAWSGVKRRQDEALADSCDREGQRQYHMRASRRDV